MFLKINFEYSLDSILFLMNSNILLAFKLFENLDSFNAMFILHLSSSVKINIFYFLL